MTRIALPFCVVAIAGCANLPPSIDSLFAEADGRHARWVEPNTVVTVRAIAADPNGDLLQYRWTPGESSGSVIVNGRAEARWHVGAARARKTLHVTVLDGEGGIANGSIDLSSGPGLVHSGTAYGPDGKPLQDALVDVNGQTTRTDEDGRYSIELTGQAANADRFVVTVESAGYATMSSVLTDGVVGARWVLAQATTASADPTRAINVTDTNAAMNCQPPYGARIDWASYPGLRVPRRVSAAGELENAPVSAPLAAAIDYVLSGGQCNPGATIAIPANALVDAGGNAPSGNVSVSLATVNLVTPNAMPGDWQARGPQEIGYIESYGAADIKVAAGSQEFQLKPGSKATLTIPMAVRPAPPKDRRTPAALPAEVPVLLYDESTGNWQRTGAAHPSAARDAYVAEIDHFSAYNVDVVKTDPACLRVNSQGIDGEYDLDIIVPTSSGVPTYRHRTIPNGPGDQQHAILNLPPNEQIGLIPMRSTPNPECPAEPFLAPIGVFVGTSGGAIPGPRLQAGDFAPPYEECGLATTDLIEVAGGEIRVDAGGRVEGPWAAVFFALANPSGDLYPLPSSACNFYGAGDPSCSLIGIVDPGATGLILQTVSPNNLTDRTDTDAALLGISASTLVNLRLNGLTRRDAMGVPEDEPGGARPAEVELPNVMARVSGELDLTLVGTAVLRDLRTYIDYTNRLSNVTEIGHPAGYVDVRFLAEGAPAPGGTPVTLDLETYAPGAQPPRYLMTNLRWQRGCGVVDQSTTRASDSNPMQFLLDLGTTRTFINDDVAAALDLPAQGDAPCYESETAPSDYTGYTIDRLSMAGRNAAYTIENAMVCKSPANIVTVTNGRLVDVVIGANLFSEVAILLDGPNETLSVSVP